MKRASRVMMIVGGLTLLASVQAQAQMLQWEDRGFVNINGAYQTAKAADVTTTSQFTIYDEAAQVTTAQTIEAKGGMLDLSAGVRLFGNFGIGAGYSAISKPGSGTVTAKIPHPLIYDLPRTATAEVDDLAHKEQAIHVMAFFVLPLSSNFDITLSGGPTFFSLEQGTLSNPQVTEVGPPYTTVNLSNVSKITTKENKVGFNVGADMTFKFAKNFGIGGFVRYSAASIDMTPEGGSAVSVDVGGLQVGGGLRLRF